MAWQSSVSRGPTIPGMAGRQCLAVLAAAMIGIPAANAGPLDVVMDGLSNPRDLTFGPGGDLFVAEAGSGGDGPTVDTATGPQSYGPSGAISRLSGGAQERIVTDLPSLAPDSGIEATGPHHLAFDSSGQLNLSIGLGADPAVRSGPLSGEPNASLLGQVTRRDAGGTMQPLADIAGREADANPDGGVVDSNAYGLAARSGGGLVVADAGGNTVYRLESDGTIASQTVFDARPNPLPFGPPSYQTVPTGVAEGPGGDIFVSELTGFPFPEGAARIWRWDGDNPGASPTVFASGLTNVVDIAFDGAGRLHALEMDSNGLAAEGGTGQLLRLTASGDQIPLITGGLTNPVGLAFNESDTAFITNNGLSPTAGQVVQAVPSPATIGLFGVGLLATAFAARHRTARRAGTR